MQSTYVDPQSASAPATRWAVLDFPAKIHDPLWSDDELPEVPALPSTVVHLEFLLQEHAIDLNAVSDVILGDLGATLQVLRMAGLWQEPDSQPTAGTRMQDHVVALGKQVLLSAIPAIGHARDGRHSLIAATWEYGASVGRAARKIASVLPGVDPEKAYIAGLLHDIGSVPLLLGWSIPGIDMVDFETVACWLSREWSLPWYITAPFARGPKSPAAALWTRIINAARESAKILASDTVSGGVITPVARCEAILQQNFPNMALLAQHQVATELAMPVQCAYRQ